MRKYAAVILLLAALVLLLCACGPFAEVSSTQSRSAVSADPSDTPSPSRSDEHSIDLKGFWMEYTDSVFYADSEEKYISLLTEKLDNISAAGFNALFFHVRSNADAGYASEIFPFAKSFTGVQGEYPGFDPLSIAVEEAHKRGIELHAWINPYRVSASGSDIEALSPKNPAYIWTHDDDPDNDSFVIPYKEGIYFNPSSDTVRRLIIDGVREILEGYDVDGIHFDDYFYPQSDSDFDIGSYAAYCRTARYPLSQADWRRANVDILVSSVWRLAKDFGKPFGISPAAPISDNGTDRNYIEYSADVYKWTTNSGYLDYIAPQLYFGYKHKLEYSRFDRLLSAWDSIDRPEGVKLYIGLPAYKIGINNDADLDEWQTDTDILARQYSDCASSTADGIIVYNYSSFFADNGLSSAQRENLIKRINEKNNVS